VEYRPVVRQRRRNKQTYDSRYRVMASLTNMFPRQKFNYENEDQCFLRGPCRGVITRTSLEFSQLESNRRVGGYCDMAASLGVRCETAAGQ
jgi:hypothetical protein